METFQICSVVSVAGDLSLQTKNVCRVHRGVTSDSIPIQSSLATGGELRDYFETFAIRKWIHLHSCLSPWLQRWFVEVTSTVGCLCSVMLTVELSWRGNVLYFLNVTLQRGKGKNYSKVIWLFEVRKTLMWIKKDPAVKLTQVILCLTIAELCPFIAPNLSNKMSNARIHLLWHCTQRVLAKNNWKTFHMAHLEKVVQWCLQIVTHPADT